MKDKKIVVAIIVYTRFENMKLWINCWKRCDQVGAELRIIHNYDKIEDCNKFRDYCLENNVTYIPRKNIGMDMGAFQDVCKERLQGFDNKWDILLWCTDDAIPMRKDFLSRFVNPLLKDIIGLTCMETSNVFSFHVRTTGFCIKKEIANELKFTSDPIIYKQDCYEFEHAGNTMTRQIKDMRYKIVMPDTLDKSSVWDTNITRYNRWNEHYKEFPKIEEIEKKVTEKKAIPIDNIAEDNAKTFIRSCTNPIKKICITTTFDKHYKEAGYTLFKSIRQHTDCTGIDFKVITADADVLKELGKENCHFITEDIKARYSNVKYSKDLPIDKYSSSWYRYEIFNMNDYDRVICIDSDCICVEDISYLFSDELNQYDLISVEDHIVSKCFNKLVPELERQGLRLANLSKRMKEGKIDVQPALLVANKSIINNKWYNKLLTYANTTPFSYSIDEGVLNDFIYMENLKIKLLPLEWDYQDIYEKVCPEVPIPSKPIIVHCQESKPFKKLKTQIEKPFHKWHDLWWKENKSTQSKTLVVIIVWNRFENLQRWINCWNQCNKTGAEMVVIHNQEIDNYKYWQLCDNNGIRYVSRENAGFDIGAFQDVCKERLLNFPNDWNNLIWITDDCIPMSKDFVKHFLDKLSGAEIPCYEISNEVKKHVRTTGFMITKEISKKLIFSRDPIHSREDCYQFEHKSKNSLFEQIVSMGKKPVMVANDLKLSPLWDSGVRSHLNLMNKHEKVFPPVKLIVPEIAVDSILDRMAIKHKSDKSSLYHNYAVKYDKILSPFRESFLSILEIGVAQGQSIKMWVDYFSKATIHGADISGASKICESYSNRIKFHLLDQSKEAQLKNLEQFSPFDLIIDDGNHFWLEQILTFNTLFPYIKKGGIYIVEDTTTSYWKEYKNNTISAVEYFKTLVDDVHLRGARGSAPINPPQEFGDWDKGWHRREDCHKSVPIFESIQFMNGFIVIYRK